MDAEHVAKRLRDLPEVAAHPGLAELGAAAFTLANVLLDDDDNLTRLGNPNGETRARLRARIEELLATSGAELDDVSLDTDP
ncbi:MAG: hypothetical protein KTR31_27925 [Myxococcales bacterium]|nr:hypothetical protein [Myxococcales bacterium]